ncbi:DNA-directed RNA polymerase, omega subunit family protein [Reticulomyxa filosa]|uniref:DNA-directed RNA polymerase, omega subunit family protein n=1 Tax=Reticulomyxa filosa TaxID=46433 RepID=X6MUI3_RETFI|nr:DNA-directed RNA polymerase, omega subunit family protein [Reticulomyxa filosa]|eukprot:ETO17469.1 DNA-directed RNA polymerase, omega subunit family protein [Reticulomyxa filosa]
MQTNKNKKMVGVQTKNILSHDLSEYQQKTETLHVELEAKEERINDMTEQLKELKTAQQKAQDWEQAYNKLAEENNQMKEQYAAMKETAQTQGQELKALTMQKQEIDMENLLFKDNNDKLTSANQLLTQKIHEMEQALV